MLISAGERIAADGRIVAGRSSLDEAAMTGDSAPADKEVGDTGVRRPSRRRQPACRSDSDASGSVCRANWKARRGSQGDDRSHCTIYRSVQRLLHASGSRLCHLLALVPPLVLSEPWTEWILSARSWFFDRLPLRAGTVDPGCHRHGNRDRRRHGILIKSGAALEQLAKIGIVAFDKTGTLRSAAQ